ncbi:Hpt domain-containing protein [Maridesulfovibrio ferrireducens]|uniref:Hpt domain-containing protein n=1 Tax=Maridesulfovibrio ferrireducens TaxID=246191 RepID=UPI001A2F650B|nr:Hpt domain-containing protein [Maridesulfovibrio ferrireducens]MBI9110902.1 Hpt domain-containing protein [Maridesulfovibrio ferrireducens]
MVYSEDSKNIVFIESALIDLVPILLETLAKELADMEETLSKDDFDKLQEQAHSSRGAALTYGFESYAEILLDLQHAAENEASEILKHLFSLLHELLESVKFESST